MMKKLIVSCFAAAVLACSVPASAHQYHKQNIHPEPSYQLKNHCRLVMEAAIGAPYMKNEHGKSNKWIINLYEENLHEATPRYRQDLMRAVRRLIETNEPAEIAIAHAHADCINLGYN